jgi:hypothetical protein
MNDTFPQTEAPNQPDVIKWFKVYCGVACFFYFWFIPVSWVFFRAPPEQMSAAEANIMGLTFLAIGFFSLALFVLPFCVEPRPWVWIYGLVLICFGMTSACCLPACVPLLIFWIKPEVKRYYGQS